jgi:uncharacterized protein YlxW (UPF0749 family)
MDEIRKILNLVYSLEEKVSQLEQENTALKQAINSACASLINQNAKMKDTLEDDEKVIEFHPSAETFKLPAWKEK